MNTLKNAMKSVGAAAADWLPDAMLLLGACLVSYGAHMIYAPAGFIVSGSFLILAGRLAARSIE
jgi:hypothetical protein